MEENKTILSNDELVEWGGWLNEFMWICAGANRRVLRQCPTDYAKYAGIGGTILFTALIIWIARRQDGLLEDQIDYIKRVQEEEEEPARKGNTYES